MLVPHRADFYQILWFQDSSPTHLVDFNPIKTGTNTLLFINKGSVQIFDKNKDFKGKLILFTDDFFCKSDSDTTFLRSTILFNDLLSISQININDSPAIFGDIVKNLETELAKPNDTYQSDILRNLLHNFLLHAERERRKQNFVEIKKDVELEYAILLKDSLELNFVSHKNVGFYANQIAITPKRLNQATSKVFGKTPKELIDERVLLECKRLLVHTKESIKEISFSLGFEEPTNFIKYFRKHTTKTPVEFREEFISA
ncbi:AraC family transcriptional regulator [Arcticibacterium luteifluviistationis]|uniref:AraC family transcriptional regulator n=2 Tax=Arcticibacterium luteifluviistationis TaxID=1784714 RepID=A0A2Z4GIF2_9BACT|nr:AraC family transcriptional regulator [Arcticibacterium luteifluviistationis]